ncbi:hypothetical protein K488DRAFT_85497 [Vararia minispora EC-137]|uniref:Uncharacterized protein n=1 Tax=Vararia minispora EC-137 TaxID=1314806 RepID=A0ACB8QMI7_9AGAM|nr:hypothetical protein K488DRAFT_85497 [Vararia minispora EC-137]
MNGPPTPPAEISPLPDPSQLPSTQTVVSEQPSSPTDTATAPAPPPSDTLAVGASSSPDPYQDPFSQIATSVSNKDYRRVIDLAELADLRPFSGQDPSRLLIITPLVLSYLIEDDMYDASLPHCVAVNYSHFLSPPARYALMRLPEGTKGHALAQALFALLASVWERRYTHVYARAEALYISAQTSDFPDPGLASVVLALVEAFVGESYGLCIPKACRLICTIDMFRKRMFALIAKAYTSINLPLAQTYLGLSQEPLLAGMIGFASLFRNMLNGAVSSAAQSHGWSFDVGTQVLTPSQAPATVSDARLISAPSTSVTFEKLADSVAALEA